MSANKALRYANYVSIVFFALMTFLSIRQTRQLLNKYGTSYVATTIVGTDVSTRTITVYDNLAVTIFFFLLMVVLMLNTLNLKTSDTE